MLEKKGKVHTIRKQHSKTILAGKKNMNCSQIINDDYKWQNSFLFLLPDFSYFSVTFL